NRAVVTGAPGSIERRPESWYTCVSPTASSAAPARTGGDPITIRSARAVSNTTGAGPRARPIDPATSSTSALSAASDWDVIEGAAPIRGRPRDRRQEGDARVRREERGRVQVLDPQREGVPPLLERLGQRAPHHHPAV